MKLQCLYDDLISIDKLQPHPKNRNKHSHEQIDRLAKILDYQGWRYPIKVSKRSGFITSGHGRLEAAKLNKWQTVPVNFQEYDSDEQEYADVQSDNAIASWAELDLAGIKLDLNEINLDVDLLGIKDFVIEPIVVPGCDEDAVPEKVEPKTKLGDIYQLGQHRLMCGDSTSIDAVEKLMAGEKADMVFTDPPYELEVEGRGFYEEKIKKHMGEIKALGIDSFAPSTLIQHCLTSVFFCNRLLIPGYLELAKNWKVKWDLCVYKKLKPIPNYSSHLITDLEYIIILGAQTPRKGMELDAYSKLYIGKKDNDNTTAWSKPVELCEKFIRLFSDRTVLDIFGGSGSTLIACEKTNRKCFMMELDPHYCDVIVARYEKYTGKKAILNG